MFFKLLLCWAREQSNQFSLLSFTWQNSTAHTKTRLLSGYDNCWCQMFVVLFLKNGLLGASLVLCSSLSGNYRRRTQKCLNSYNIIEIHWPVVNEKILHLSDRRWNNYYEKVSKLKKPKEGTMISRTNTHRDVKIIFCNLFWRWSIFSSFLYLLLITKIGNVRPGVIHLVHFAVAMIPLYDTFGIINRQTQFCREMKKIKTETFREIYFKLIVYSKIIF